MGVLGSRGSKGPRVGKPALDFTEHSLVGRIGALTKIEPSGGETEGTRIRGIRCDSVTGPCEELGLVGLDIPPGYVLIGLAGTGF